MRVAIAQLSPIVGAFEQNTQAILRAYEKAVAAQAQLLVAPELTLCGYPPHDLVDRPEMFERGEAALKVLCEATKNKKTAMLIGAVRKNPSATGRAARNLAIGIHNGQIVFEQAKTLLPTYDVFDEARYFEPATSTVPWEFYGKRIGVVICEDLWARDPSFGRRLYGRDPSEDVHASKVDLIISLSASPFVADKVKTREELHSDVARRIGAPLIYVNQVGGTDEILFDGGSFATTQKGILQGRLPFFKESLGIVDLGPSDSVIFESPTPKDREDQVPPTLELVYRGLVHGISEYFRKTGFKRAVIGLSGGIDSALVAALATSALGPKNVLGVAMPGPYSSGHSMEDAQLLAKNLGISFEVKPIKFLYSVLSRELSESRGEALEGVTLENLQARLRGLVLMTLSNHYNGLVLATGNKSELATGYCTLYGDMCGALAPLGDVLKTQVFALSRWINQSGLLAKDVIPPRSIEKPPSAELRPDQKDEDSLPPYALLDELIQLWIEQNLSASETCSRLESKLPSRPGWVAETIKLIERNEYKRKQAAPVIKVSPKAFGMGRRVPIAKIWD